MERNSAPPTSRAASPRLRISPGSSPTAEDIDSQQFTIDPAELAYINQNSISWIMNGEYTASAGVSYGWKDNQVYLDWLFGSGLRTGFANLLAEPQYYPVNVGYDAHVSPQRRAQQKL